MKHRHFVIPDRQVKRGVPLDYNRWLGYAIRDYEPDRLIDLGDDGDFPSLSSYSSALEKEGARLKDDIETINYADELLFESMGTFRPVSMHKLMGNHNERLCRFLNDNPVLQGLIDFDLFNHKQLGWNFHPYFHGTPAIIELDGLSYAHYFAYVNSGKAIGGTASYKLAAIGAPFVQGHVQGYDIGTKQFATGRTIRGVVVGSCYLHDEPFKGHANTHFRGALVLNEVEKGNFLEMPLSMDYLCRKYEGMGVARFLQRKYKNAKQRFSLASTT